jgi:Trypsin-like peptidase domain
VQFFISLLILWLSFPPYALGNYLTGAEQLSAEGAQFAWPDVRSKSLKIFIEYQEGNGNWKRASLGSGFLISPDGLFVTAYHVMKYCLQNQRETSSFAVSTDCSAIHRPAVNSLPVWRYKAQNDDQEFGIQILSHLKEADSTAGRNFHTPDEIIKHRDFVVGRLIGEPEKRFSYWEMMDFEQGTISLSSPRADFELKPLLPPKRVFIAGYPRDRDFEVAHGFLNLTEEHNRGYFAADFRVYSVGYLKSLGISPDTNWGMRVENHMSGGAAVDSSGSLVGVVVNGSENTAGILSIENILETFFSRAGKPGTQPSIILTPTKTPLYLKENPAK